MESRTRCTDHNLISSCFLRVPNSPLHAPRDAKSVMRRGGWEKAMNIAAMKNAMSQAAFDNLGYFRLTIFATRVSHHTSCGFRGAFTPDARGPIDKNSWQTQQRAVRGKTYTANKKRSMFPPTTKNKDQFLNLRFWPKEDLPPFPAIMKNGMIKLRYSAIQIWRGHTLQQGEGKFPPATGNGVRNERRTGRRSYPVSPPFSSTK